MIIAANWFPECSLSHMHCRRNGLISALCRTHFKVDTTPLTRGTTRRNSLYRRLAINQKSKKFLDHKHTRLTVCLMRQRKIQNSIDEMSNQYPIPGIESVLRIFLVSAGMLHRAAISTQMSLVPVLFLLLYMLPLLLLLLSPPLLLLLQ